MSKFKLGDIVTYTGSDYFSLRGISGTIVSNQYAPEETMDDDGDYRVMFTVDGQKIQHYIAEDDLCPVYISPKITANPKPGDKVKFLVEGTILREDSHPSNWIINAPLFWGTGETRHIRKTSVVEVTESLTFEIGQAVPAEDVSLLPLGALLNEPWSGQMVVVGHDSLIYMDSSSLPFSNIDPHPSDEYYVVISLPKEA